MLSLIIFSTFLTLIYIWIKKRAKFWTDRGFPSADFIFPIGSLKDVGTKKSFCEGLDENYKKFKGKSPAVGYFTFTAPTLLAIDPELIKTILVTNFENFIDRPVFYNKKDDPISPHLLALEGKAWKDRRTMLTPTFTSGKMKIMFETVDYVADQLVTAIEQKLKINSIIEMYEFSCRFTTDGISNVAFGLDSNSINDDHSEMRKHGKEIIEFGPAEFLKFFFTSSFPNFSRRVHLTPNKKFITDYFFNTFKYNFELRESGKVYRKDFVQLLLDLKQKHSLTTEEIAAEAFIFFLAGFDTSSNLISFVLFELANNQDVQTRLRDEIMDAVQGNDGKFTYDMIFGMKYLDMVIKETLRKFPPAFNLMRTSKNDFTIPDTNLVIPGGTDIQISVFSLHRDPVYFPEPEKFDPERFSPENIDKIRPCTFLPFGFGQRACIGKRYASMKTKIGIAKLVLNFEILRCAKTPDEPIDFKKTGLFLNSAEGMWLKLRKLNNNQ